MTQPTVVLIHGLGRTKAAMGRLARYLKKRGYRVENWGYPSQGQSLEALVANYIEPNFAALLAPQPQTPVHVVTHSLGGVLVRQYLQQHALPAGSRVVMLAPPNHGSEAAQWLKRFGWARKWYGPILEQLSRDDEAVWRNLKPINCELGVIAGTRSGDPWFNFLFNRPHDGKVAVESARLPEAQDFKTVAATHTFIMNHPKVRRWVVNFLQKGRFD